MVITHAQGYAPGWDLDLQLGTAGENYAAAILGLQAGRVEVKTDRHLDSSNLFVETHTKRGDSWQPSGIKTTEADAWAFVFGATVTFVPTNILRAAVALFDLPAVVVEKDVPTRGVLLPRTLLQRVTRG